MTSFHDSRYSGFRREQLWAIKALDMRVDALAAVYDLMEMDRLVETVFYNGGITGPVSFTDFSLARGSELRTVYHGNDVVGVVWLNNPQGKACMVHFCILRRFWEHQREIGIWTVRQYLEPLNPATGKPYLSALYGLTPAAYRHAIAFITSIGFRVLGKIPGACEFRRPGGPVFRDGIASVCTLDDVVRAEAL